jgi:hypothetical protein
VLTDPPQRVSTQEGFVLKIVVLKIVVLNIVVLKIVVIKIFVLNVSPTKSVEPA